MVSNHLRSLLRIMIMTGSKSITVLWLQPDASNTSVWLKGKGSG